MSRIFSIKVRLNADDLADLKRKKLVMKKTLRRRHAKVSAGPQLDPTPIFTNTQPTAARKNLILYQ